MGVTKIWGAKSISGGYISTGMFRCNHNVNHYNYCVFTQPKQQNIEIVVTGAYATYFTCEVRNRSTGTLVSAYFSFQIVGNNLSE